MQRLKEGPAIYSARNYTQYPVINQNRKEYEKNACVILNHFTVRRKLTQHCESTVLQLKKKRAETVRKKADLRERQVTDGNTAGPGQDLQERGQRKFQNKTVQGVPPLPEGKRQTSQGE